MGGGGEERKAGCGHRRPVLVGPAAGRAAGAEAALARAPRRAGAVRSEAGASRREPWSQQPHGHGGREWKPALPLGPRMDRMVWRPPGPLKPNHVSRNHCAALLITLLGSELKLINNRYILFDTPSVIMVI